MNQESKSDCVRGHWAGKCRRTGQVANASLPSQAQTLLEVIKEEGTVDIVGFSLGAGVALATACLDEGRDCIRKLHLSGVATDRSDYGHLAVQAWKECVQSDPSLRSFAWSVLLATYSLQFLRTQPIDKYIDHICKTNSRDGLFALLRHAEATDPADPWQTKFGPPELLAKLAWEKWIKWLQKRTHEILPRGLDERIFSFVPKCAHAVGMEGARFLRNVVIDFLNNP